MADYELPPAAVEAAEADMAGIVKNNLEELTAEYQTKRQNIEAKYLDDWAGPVIMGSFIPAIFALIVVFTGQIIINSNTGLCNFNFNEFISAAVAVGYFYLIVFSWIFLGDDIRLPIVNWPILMPFTSLKWVVTFFTIIGIASFIINCVGTYEIIFGIFCASSAPVLYNYSCFIVAVYWIGFFVVAFSYIKLTLGKQIRGTLEAVQQDLGVGGNQLTPQEELFKSKFDELDTNKTNTIPKSSLRTLTASLDIPMTLKKRSELALRLDPDDTGSLEYSALFEWYKQAVTEMDANLGEDDEEEEGEEGGGAEGGDGAKQS